MVIIAHIVLLRKNLTPRKNWAILVRNGKILETGPAGTMLHSHPGEKVLVLRNALVMPGLINIHSHLELPFLMNRIKCSTYSSWVLNLLKIKRSLTKHDYRKASEENIRSLIQTGTTTVGEISTQGTSPEFLSKSGMRAAVFQEIISMSPGRPLPPRSSLPPRDRALIRHGISPHSPHTVSEQTFIALRTLLARKHSPLSIHAAETKAEGRLLRREKSDLDKLYKAAGWERAWAPKASSSVALLDRLGVLGPNTLLVHAVDVNDGDIGMIKRTGSAVAHCPRSNHSLGVGTMKLRKMLDAGVVVGLGTDSLASTATLNLWDEMRFAFAIHRKTGVTPKEILHMATMGGAKALGREKEVGSLDPGKKADIIAVPLPGKFTGDIHSDLLRETEYSIMTMVNGKILHPDEAS